MSHEEETQSPKLKLFNLTDAIMKKAVQATEDGLESEDEREKSVAVRSVSTMSEANRKLAEFLSKEARLDAGRPTDIVSNIDQFQAQIDEEENLLNEAGYGSTEESEEGTD